MSHCRMDRHWKPFISQCAYCDIPYAVIAKAETFLEDQSFIGLMAGVNFANIKSPNARNSTEDLSNVYFKQLDRQTVKQLFTFYQMDFEMFGYSPELYFTHALN